MNSLRATLMCVLIRKSVSTHFNFPYDNAPSDVQLELIELHASDVILSKVTSCTTLIDFYRQLPHAVSNVVSPCQACDRNVWQHLFVRAAVLQNEVL
ncbi:unnamed protein product [Schistocephalus solidus]|uniref:Secreted protein n=1 Tax=Schistocephalus solidus TaxID=70667 RepID=A0A183TEH7_SCHSO|nr:unnamed protein product [Schistocephalus solidus]